MRSIGRLAGQSLKSFFFLAFLAIFVGCSSTGNPDPATVVSADDMEVRNLRSSTEVLKTALGAMARERDDYKDRFLSAEQEVHTRLASVEYLEARHRVHLQLLTKAERLAAQASGAADALQVQLEDQARRYGDNNATLAKMTTDLREKTDTVTTVSQALARVESEVKRLESENSQLQERVSGDVVRDDKRLERKDQELATTRLQIQELKRELIDVKRERDAAAAQAGTAGTASTEVVKVGSGKPAAATSATGFLIDWWNRSVTEVSAGQFNDDNRLLLALVGAGVILLTLTFFFMARAAGARSRVRDLTQQLVDAAQPTGVMPLRADEVSPAVAQVSLEAEQLAATMHMNQRSSDQPLPVTPLEGIDQSQGVVQQSAISRQLDDVLGERNEEATMMIPTPAQEPEEMVFRSTGGGTEGDAETVHDDALLSDLKSAIQEKFAELRDK